MINRILGLNQYGIFITMQNGHIYLNYESDYDLSPTTESQILLSKMSKAGIFIREKRYEDLEEVLNSIDKVLKFLGLGNLEETGEIFNFDKCLDICDNVIY